LAGDAAASEEIFQLVYAELRAMAQTQMSQERPGHTLNATALVHEAYVKMNAGARSPWQSQSHFCAVAAQAMRRILVDHARSRGRIKRGAGLRRQELFDIAAPDQSQSFDVLTLDEALSRLAALEPVAARVVEMRYFAGLTEQAIAGAMGISDRTVRRHWVFAKAWLYRDLATNAAAADEAP